MKEKTKQRWKLVWQVIGSILAVIASYYVGLYSALILVLMRYWGIVAVMGVVMFPSLIFPLIWVKRKLRYFGFWCIFLLIFVVLLGVNRGIEDYNEQITVDVTPNINLQEYLPFREDSKIVKLRSKTLELQDNLPVVDGAAAVFPVYSAFVNATYPETTELYDGVFSLVLLAELPFFGDGQTVK